MTRLLLALALALAPAAAAVAHTGHGSHYYAQIELENERLCVYVGWRKMRGLAPWVCPATVKSSFPFYGVNDRVK